MRSFNAIHRNGFGAINTDAHIVLDGRTHSYRHARHLTALSTLVSLGDRLSAMAITAMRQWLVPSTGPWQLASCPMTPMAEAAKPREAQRGLLKRLVSPAVVAA
jgi:hypothetical protein